MLTTAGQIIERAQRLRPDLKLAVSASGGAIGVWSEELGRYVMVVGRLLDGLMGPGEHWVDCPGEILINGLPPVSDWVPVEVGFCLERADFALYCDGGSKRQQFCEVIALRTQALRNQRLSKLTESMKGGRL